MPGPMDSLNAEVLKAVEDVNEAVRTSEASLSADFTCLFNQRPRQEAGPTQLCCPHGNAAVNCGASTRGLLSAGERGEVGTRECRRRERRSVRLCLL